MSELKVVIIKSIGIAIALLGLSQYANADTKYVRFGCVNNGDGTANSCASSGGGAGGYNTLAHFNDTASSLVAPLTVYVDCEDCSAAEDPTDAIDMGSWVTTATNTLTIEGLNTGRTNGAWSTSRYRLQPSAGHAYYSALRVLNSDWITIDGLQIYNNDTTGGGRVGVDMRGSGGGIVTIKNCILRSQHGDIYDESSNDGGSAYTLNLINNIFDIAGSGKNAINSRAQTSSSNYIYNNTIVAGSVGLSYSLYGSGATVTLKNNLVYNTSTSDYASIGGSNATLVTSNNASEDLSSPDSSYRSATYTFASGADYHLASGDSGAKDRGADLSGTFTLDIDSQTRSGTWDIGADEYQASGSAVAALISTGQIGYQQ